LKIACEIGDRHSEAIALSNLALIFFKHGERTQAVANAQTALEIFEQIQDPTATKIRKILAQWQLAQ
jgi:hypothetical protein